MSNDFFVRKLKSETQPIQTKLALKWRVLFDKSKAGTIYLVSNVHTQTHTLFVHDEGVLEMERELPKLVSHLCRAKLAETVEPSFATLQIASPYNQDIGKYWMLFYAWQHTALWANDLRHRLFPYLSMRGRISTEEFLGRISTEIPPDPSLRPVYAVASALEIAKRRRYNGKADLSLDSVVGLAPLVHLIRELVGLYESPLLRHLPSQKTPALQLLEDSVRQACVILGFPIDPWMMEQNGTYHWKC